MEKVKTEGLLRKLLPAFVFFAAAALAVLVQLAAEVRVRFDYPIMTILSPP